MTLSRDLITDILTQARSAPTPDNAQPWRFNFNGHILFIEHVESRASHPLNPENLSSVIALGCVVEAIAISASRFKIKTETELTQLPAGENEIWAKLTFIADQASPDEMLSSMELRSTDRRVYRKGIEKLPRDKIKLLSTPRAQLHIAPVTEDLVEYIVKTEEFLPKHPRVLPAVLKWVRFSLEAARNTGDGLSWHNMGVKFYELPGVKLIQKFPWMLNILRPTLLAPHRARTRAQVLSAAALIAVSIPLDTRGEKTGIERNDVVQAGSTMFRAWLELTHAGFGVQPLSLSTFPIYFARSNQLDEFLTANIDLIRSGEALLRKKFEIPDNRLPIWLFRTGLADPLPNQQRTFRRPLDLRHS